MRELRLLQNHIASSPRGREKSSMHKKTHILSIALFSSDPANCHHVLIPLDPLWSFQQTTLDGGLLPFPQAPVPHFTEYQDIG